MKKTKARKLQLQRLSIRTLDAAQGGGAYMSYGKHCSNSCSSCGKAGCEIVAPSNGPNVCSQYY